MTLTLQNWEIVPDDTNNRVIFRSVDTGNEFYLTENGTIESPDGVDLGNGSLTGVDWANSDAGQGSGLDADSVDGSEPPFNNTVQKVLETSSFAESGVAVDGLSGSASASRRRLETVYGLSSPTFSQSFDVSGQDTSPEGMAWNSDGSKLYMIGDANANIYSYTCSTAYDISTASYNQSFSVGTQDANPRGMAWKPDGSKLYFVGVQNDNIYSYNCSTAYDISTASYNQSFDVSGQETGPQGMAWNGDGSKMYIVGRNSDTIYSYTCPTTYEISPASYSQSLDVSEKDRVPMGIAWNGDGSKLYMVGTDYDSIYSYNCSTAYDISTASYNQSFPMGAQDTGPTGMAWNGDGSKLYMVGDGTNSIYSYDTYSLPARANVRLPSPEDIYEWDFATFQAAPDGGSVTVDVTQPSPLFNNSIHVGGEDVVPVGIAWNGNGSKLYMVGLDNANIYSYTCSTAYDISTASFNQSFSVSGQDSTPGGIAWNGNGSKLYMVGYGSDSIHSYNCSTAYDISTASFNQSFDVSGQDTNPRAIAWNGDGSKVYISGRSSTSIHSYNCSTAYDISTASYNQSFDVSTRDTEPEEIAWNGNGSKLYVAGNASVSIYSYDCSTAYDISTASLNQLFDVSTQDTEPAGMAWNGNGSKLYMVGFSNDRIYSYDCSTAYDLVEPVASNITRNTDITTPADASRDAFLTVTLGGTEGSNFPALEYGAVVYNR